MTKFEQNEHWVFLYWLVFTGLIIFLGIIALIEGFLATLFTADRSKIVFLIAGLYLFGTVRAGFRAKFLSEEIDFFRTSILTTRETSKSDPDLSSTKKIENSRIFINKRDYRFFEREENNVNLLFFLHDKCKGNHDFNWFISESILKLGLLGTIIGFILMLGPVIEITSFDVSSMQQILSKMSAGMGTALYTTLAGILGSSTLAFQNLILDKGSDNLINEILLVKTKIPFGGSSKI